MKEKESEFVSNGKIIELFYSGFTKEQLEKFVASSNGLTQLEARKKVELALYDDCMKTSPRNGNSRRGHIEK